jgi:hypothetical protein
MCQSLAKPSSAEYWHIGETPMRLAKETERSWKGAKRGWLMMNGGLKDAGGPCSVDDRAAEGMQGKRE